MKQNNIRGIELPTLLTAHVRLTPIPHYPLPPQRLGEERVQTNRGTSQEKRKNAESRRNLFNSYRLINAKKRCNKVLYKINIKWMMRYKLICINIKRSSSFGERIARKAKRNRISREKELLLNATLPQMLACTRWRALEVMMSGLFLKTHAKYT